MTIMVHAGYLKLGANKEEAIKGGAVNLFFKHRDEVIKILKEEDSENVEYYDAMAQGDIIKNREDFPTFHINWIDGIVTSCLKVLNRKPYVANDILLKDPSANNAVVQASIYDPHYVYDAITLSPLQPDNYPFPPPVPPLPLSAPKVAQDLNLISTYFGYSILGGKTPYNTAVATTEFLLTDPVQQSAYLAAIPTSLSAAENVKYKKQEPGNFIPATASEEFEDLTFDTDLSLPDKQKNISIALVEALDTMVTTLKLYPNSENYLEAIAKQKGITTQNNAALNELMKLAKKTLEDKFPDPRSDNAFTAVVNYKALISFLCKPLMLSSIGVIFGSSENGFVGKMKSIAPDDVGNFNDKPGYPDPSPTKLNFEEDRQEAITEVAAYGNGRGTIEPMFKFRYSNIQKINNPEPLFYEKVVAYALEKDINPLHIIRVAINESQLYPSILRKGNPYAAGLFELTQKEGTSFATKESIIKFASYAAASQFDVFIKLVFSPIIDVPQNQKCFDRSGPGAARADFYKLVFLPFSTADVSTGRITTVQGGRIPKKGTDLYNQNPGVDFNKDDEITMSDLGKTTDFILPADVESSLSAALSKRGQTIEQFYKLSALQDQKYRM